MNACKNAQKYDPLQDEVARAKRSRFSQIELRFTFEPQFLRDFSCGVFFSLSELICMHKVHDLEISYDET